MAGFRGRASGTQKIPTRPAPKPGRPNGALAMGEPAAPHGSPAHVAQISQQLRNVGIPNPIVRN